MNKKAGIRKTNSGDFLLNITEFIGFPSLKKPKSTVKEYSSVFLLYWFGPYIGLFGRQAVVNGAFCSDL